MSGKSLTERCSDLLHRAIESPSNERMYDTVNKTDLKQFNTLLSTYEKSIISAVIESIYSQRNNIDLDAIFTDENINNIFKKVNDGNGFSSNQHRQLSDKRQAIRHSYHCAHKLQEILSNEIKQTSRVHLNEQLRLLVFRVASAMGIAMALIFMGLLANQLGVQIGIPFLRIIG